MAKDVETLLLTGFDSHLSADTGSGATYATLDLHLWCAATQKTTVQRVAIPRAGLEQLSQALLTLLAQIAQIEATPGRA